MINCVKQIAKDIRRELQAAEHYAMLASKYRDDHHELSEVYNKIAEQELDHANRFHTAAVRMLEDHKAKHGEIPHDLAQIWDWEREMLIEESAVIETALHRR